MDRDAVEEAGPRELRLEGLTLAIAGGVLIAALFGAFQLGRAVERWTAPSRASGSSGDAPASAEQEAVDSTEKLTFFDTLSGPGKEAEPGRQTQAAASAAATPEPPAATPGAWFVQVFVGRDRQAAEEVVRTLRTQRYPVRIDSVSEGTGSLFKVRVGGYPTKEAADAGAEKLHGDGHAGTWVVRVGK